ncbi:hypothetical protein HG530_005287 [Fusarium avenaceum]|nr:hypothetical protein HG530_005287 [Fusarium avenaceum]
MDNSNPFQQTFSSSNREDVFSGPEELSSNSNSPSSAACTTDGRASPSGSTSTTTESGRVSIASVPAACLACRGKHLKCDGVNPCSRCLSSGSECIYVASRRGYKGPRRNAPRKQNKRPSVSPSRARTRSNVGSSSFKSVHTTPLGSPGFLSPNMADDIYNSSFSTPFPDPALTGSSNNETDISFFQPYATTDASNDMYNMFATQQHEHIPTYNPVPTLPERCIDYFYSHFYAAHPFVLPREYLLSIAEESSVEPVLAVMRWIGSLYVPACPHRAHFFQEAHQAVYKSHRGKDGFRVQALLLLLIGLDGQGQQEQAREMLAEAAEMAVEIGLNTRSFATTHGRGIPVMEESWRRTWWDLYVVDGLIAGLHRRTSFLLFDITCDVALPCEEQQYLSGNIPQVLYLQDVIGVYFPGVNRELSSFTYRILAIQNLGKLLSSPPASESEDQKIEHIETLLTKWRLDLPRSKLNPQHHGHLDEMMFQGHMITHATSILLHQPHSQLNSLSTQSTNLSSSVSSIDTLNTHTKHTIHAATEISKLTAYRVPLLSHTPFLNYVMTISSTMHLSRWALFYMIHDGDNLRHLIRLNTGAISKMSLVWGAAERERRSMKGMAQEIYQVKKQHQSMSQFWLGITHEEVINMIAADDSIIREFESVQGMPGMMG